MDNDTTRQEEDTVDDDGVRYHMSAVFYASIRPHHWRLFRRDLTVRRRRSAVASRTCQNMKTPTRGSFSSLGELVREFDELLERVADYSLRFPDVEGMDKILKAVTREKEVALNLLSGPQGGDDGLRHGVDNNFRGLLLEFECAVKAPGVVAVRKRFASRPPSMGAKLADDEVVEVDVVAQDGLLWIECKAEKGNVSPSIVPQTLAMQKMARACCNRRCFGRAPEVGVYLTGTLDEAEAHALREAGIRVITAVGSELRGLPPLPSSTAVANLDITALFALVSEVSNLSNLSRSVLNGSNDTGVESIQHVVATEVRKWAAQKSQHAACLQAELEQPLDIAEKLKEYSCLIAHPNVVERFETILYTVGGPREQGRWEEEWSPRVKVMNKYKIVAAEEIDENAKERDAWRRAVRGLTRISEPQLDAFEIGEVEMAKTFTANGRAVTLAAEQGIFLEVFVFKAIWLVGL